MFRSDRNELAGGVVTGRLPGPGWIGSVTRADLGKDPRAVAAMFDGVARRYDLTNDVISIGRTASWRRAVVAALQVRPRDVILDLAAGTASSSVPISRLGASVVPCDFSLGMLEEGKRRQAQLPFVAGDALRLPFADGTFDAVTISFGLRNLIDPAAGLAEMARVTRPGGRLVVCEFSTPVNPVFRKIYLEYLMSALPALARRVAANPDAYAYLAESVRAWPNQSELSQLLIRSGWERVRYRNLTGGVVALHRAWK